MNLLYSFNIDLGLCFIVYVLNLLITTYYKAILGMRFDRDLCFNVREESKLLPL